ncbi:tellurite resistance TerB family protein [Allochromatium palmeri]|uniref:Co-chaperone DjlA N-terminal domain-containing protein n=1 Tax=Allochromatium palmeri TaxID=231048 RepID=A0A6N8EEC5_9GAMM|nr:TerB family tellurite resistance protein [Allochromatium palmeri]MTW22612.1 hypothetical protein [Allochromatium palmeri]
MSILKNLANRTFDAVVPDAWASAWNRLVNEDFMRAFAGCCALVACADNVVEESEIEKVREYIKSNLKYLKGYEIAPVMKQFNDYVAAITCDPDEGRDEIYKALKEVKPGSSLWGADQDSAKALVRVSCKLAASGSDFDENEKNAIKDICEQLNVDYREFKELV